MKRTAEFVLGLIGGILGIIIAFITLVGAISLLLGNEPVEGIEIAFTVIYTIGLILSIVGLVFACRVNKNSKVSGIMMIIAGVGVFLCNVLNVASLILFLIAGIMCLTRKMESENEKII